MSWMANEWKQGLPGQALKKVNEMEDQLERLQKERGQKHVHIETLQQALEKEKRKIEEEKQQQTELKRELQTMTEACEELEKRRQKLHLDVSSKDSQINCLQGQLDAVRQQRDKETMSVRKLENEMVKWQSSVVSPSPMLARASVQSTDGSILEVNVADEISTSDKLQEDRQQQFGCEKNSPLKMSVQCSNIRSSDISGDCISEDSSEVARQENVNSDWQQKLETKDMEIVLLKKELTEAHKKLQQSLVEIQEQKSSQGNGDVDKLQINLDEKTEKLATLEQKLKQMSQEMTCQRHNHDAIRLNLEQKLKDREKELNGSLIHENQKVTDLEKKIQDLIQKMQQQQTQAQQLENNLKAQLGKADEKNKELEKEFNDIKSQLSQEIEKSLLAEGNTEQLGKKLKSAEMDREAFSTAVASMEAKVKEVEALLIANIEEQASQEDNLESLQATVASQNLELDVLKQEKVEYEKKFQEFQEMVSSKNNEGEAWINKCNNLQGQIESLQEELETCKSVDKEKEEMETVAMAMSITQLQADKEAMETSLLQLRAENESYNAVVSSKDMALRELQEDYNGLKEQIETMIMSLKGKEVTVQQLSSQLQQDGDKIEALLITVDDLEEQLKVKSESEEQVEELELLRENLREANEKAVLNLMQKDEEISLVKDHLSKLENLLSEEQAKVYKLESDLVQKESHFNLMNLSSDNFQRAMEESERKLHELELKYYSLEDVHQVLETEFGMKQNEVNSLTVEKQALETNMEESKVQLEKERFLVAELKRTVEETQCQMELKNLELLRLNEELEAKQEECAKLKEEGETLIAMQNDLVTQLRNEKDAVEKGEATMKLLESELSEKIGLIAFLTDDLQDPEGEISADLVKCRLQEKDEIITALKAQCGDWKEKVEEFDLITAQNLTTMTLLEECKKQVCDLQSELDSKEKLLETVTLELEELHLKLQSTCEELSAMKMNEETSESFQTLMSMCQEKEEMVNSLMVEMEKSKALEKELRQNIDELTKDLQEALNGSEDLPLEATVGALKTNLHETKATVERLSFELRDQEEAFKQCLQEKAEALNAKKVLEERIESQEKERASQDSLLLELNHLKESISSKDLQLKKSEQKNYYQLVHIAEKPEDNQLANSSQSKVMPIISDLHEMSGDHENEDLNTLMKIDDLNRKSCCHERGDSKMVIVEVQKTVIKDLKAVQSQIDVRANYITQSADVDLSEIPGMQEFINFYKEVQTLLTNLISSYADRFHVEETLELACEGETYMIETLQDQEFRQNIHQCIDIAKSQLVFMRELQVEADEESTAPDTKNTLSVLEMVFQDMHLKLQDIEKVYLIRSRALNKLQGRPQDISYNMYKDASITTQSTPFNMKKTAIFHRCQDAESFWSYNESCDKVSLNMESDSDSSMYMEARNSLPEKSVNELKQEEAIQDSSENKVFELQHKLARSEEVIKEMKQKVCMMEDTLDVRHDQENFYMHQNYFLRQQVEEKTVEVRKLKKYLDKMTIEVRRLYDLQDQLDEELKTSQSSIIQLLEAKIKNEENEQRREILVSSLRNELETKSSELEILKEHLEQNMAQVQKLQERRQVESSTRCNLEEELQMSAAVVASLQRELESILSMQSADVQQMIVLKCELETFKIELQAKQSLLDCAYEKLSEMGNEIALLKAEQTRDSNEAKICTKDVSISATESYDTGILSEQFVQLSADVSDIFQQEEKIEMTICDSENALQEAKVTIIQHVQEVKRLQEELSKWQEKANCLEVRIKEIENTHDKELKQQHYILETVKAELELTSNRLCEVLEENSRLSSISAEAESWKAEVSVLRDAMMEMSLEQSQLNSIKSDLNETSEKLHRAEEVISQLTMNSEAEMWKEKVLYLEGIVTDLQTSIKESEVELNHIQQKYSSVCDASAQLELDHKKYQQNSQKEKLQLEAQVDFQKTELDVTIQKLRDTEMIANQLKEAAVKEAEIVEGKLNYLHSSMENMKVQCAQLKEMSVESTSESSKAKEKLQETQCTLEEMTQQYQSVVEKYMTLEKEYSEKMSESQALVTELQSKQQSGQEKILALEKKVKELENQVSDGESEIDEMGQKIQSMDSEKVKLKQEKNRLEKEIEGLVIQLTSTQLEVTECEKQISHLVSTNSELTRLQKMIEDLEQERKEIQECHESKISILGKEMSRASKQLSDATGECESLYNQLQVLLKEKKCLKETVEEQILIQKNFEAARDQIKKLEKDMAILGDSNRKICTEYDEKMTELSSIMAERDKLNVELEEQKHENSDLLQKLHVVIQIRDGLLQDLKELQERKEQEMGNFEEAQEQIKKLEKDLASLGDNNRKICTEFDEKTTELSSIMAERDKLNVELKEQKHENSDLLQKLGDVIQIRDGLLQDLKELQERKEQEMGNIEEEKQQLKEEIDKLRIDCVAAEKQAHDNINQLQKEVDLHMRKWKQGEEKEKELCEKINHLESLCDSKETETNQLRQEMDILSSKMTELKREAANKDFSLVDLQNVVEKMKEELLKETQNSTGLKEMLQQDEKKIADLVAEQKVFLEKQEELKEKSCCLEQMLQEKEATINSLQDAAREKNTEQVQMEANIQKLKTAQEANNNEISRKSKELELKEKRVTELQMEVSGLREKLQKTQMYMKKMEESLQTHLSKKKDLESTAESLRCKLQELERTSDPRPWDSDEFEGLPKAERLTFLDKELSLREKYELALEAIKEVKSDYWIEVGKLADALDNNRKLQEAHDILVGKHLLLENKVKKLALVESEQDHKEKGTTKEKPSSIMPPPPPPISFVPGRHQRPITRSQSQGVQTRGRSTSALGRLTTLVAVSAGKAAEKSQSAGEEEEEEPVRKRLSPTLGTEEQAASKRACHRSSRSNASRSSPKMPFEQAEKQDAPEEGHGSDVPSTRQSRNQPMKNVKQVSVRPPQKPSPGDKKGSYLSMSRTRTRASLLSKPLSALTNSPKKELRRPNVLVSPTSQPSSTDAAHSSTSAKPIHPPSESRGMLTRQADCEYDPNGCKTQ